MNDRPTRWELALCVLACVCLALAASSTFGVWPLA